MCEMKSESMFGKLVTLVGLKAAVILSTGWKNPDHDLPITARGLLESFKNAP